MSNVKYPEYTTEDWQDLYPVGTAVNVERREDDQFNHDFTGRVKGYHDQFITVEDQDGDCWDCDPEQLSFNTDSIMHS